MTRKEYLRHLLMNNRLKDALDEMANIASGSYYDNSVIHLFARYNGLKKDIQNEVISSENRTLRANRLIAAAQGLMADLEQEVPEKMHEVIDAKKVEDQTGDPTPDPVMEPSAAKYQPEKKEQHFHFHGNVGSVNTDNKGTINQNIDMSTNKQTIEQKIDTFQQLVQAQEKDGFITRDEYEDLMDLLEEIKETKEPGERQQSRWKRAMGKAVTKTKEFVAKRLEKGADTLVAEETKKLLKDGLLDQMIEIVGGVL